MKDIAENVDRLKELADKNNSDADAEAKRIFADFFGEIVGNSRRVATALETIAEKGIAITVPTETHSQITQLAWEAGQNFAMGNRAG